MSLRLIGILFIGLFSCLLGSGARAFDFVTRTGIKYQSAFLSGNQVGSYDSHNLNNPIWFDSIKSIHELVKDCLKPNSRTACLQANQGSSPKTLNLFKLAISYCRTISAEARLFTESEYQGIVDQGVIDYLPGAKATEGRVPVRFLSQTQAYVRDDVPYHVIVSGNDLKTHASVEIAISDQQIQMKIDPPLSIRCVLDQNVGVSAVDANVDEIPWVSQGIEKEGIQVSSKVIPGEAFYAFRGEGIIDAPLEVVASILADYSRYDEWVDKMAKGSFKLLDEKSFDSFVGYLVVELPRIPLVYNRDFVVQYTMNIGSKDKVILLMQSTDEFPIINKNNVRGELINSQYVMTRQPNGATHIIAEILTKPNGWLPSFVVNKFQKAWPHNTLTSLRRQAEKKDLKISKDLVKLLK